MAKIAIFQKILSSIYSKLTCAEHDEISDTDVVTVKQAQETSIYTINELLVQRARCMPDTRLLAYPSTAKGKDDYCHYTAGDLDRFADTAAKAYMVFGIAPKENNVDEVIALLGDTNLDYIVAIFALSRLGYALLLLSRRLATEAHISLLKETKCRRIVSASTLEKTIQAIGVERDITSYPILGKSSYDEPHLSTPYFMRKYDRVTASKRIAFIIHSSGSTGMPRPIFQTHEAALMNYSSGLGYRAFLTLPLYHNHGLSTFFRALYSGNEIGLFNSNLPMTSNNLIAAMEKLKPSGFHGVPYALKLLGEDRRGIEVLRACKSVMFAGSSCPDDLGNRLVEAGIYLVSHYGATEIGQIMTSLRSQGDKSWNYLRPLPGRDRFMYFTPCGPDLYELIVLNGLPSKVVSNSDDPPNSFHTADIFTPHATIPNAWKHLGRLDDRINLLNGEKCLPISFEHLVRGNDYVQECWMFGIGRALPGIMIVPSEKCRSLSKTELFNKIWPSIEAANLRAESFGKVSKEMTTILEVGTEYPITDKGTMIRAATYKKFSSQINHAYEIFEKGSLENGAKLALNIPEIEQYLLDAFQNMMHTHGLTTATEFFEAGVDSLQAVRMWGLIKRELDLGIGDVGQNVVFEYPSIKRLSEHLYALRENNDNDKGDELKKMTELVQKYSQFSQHIPGPNSVAKETIVLTGATGSLGAHTLSQIIIRDNVEAVYCLVRASSVSDATYRVLSALSSRLLTAIPKCKIICLPTDLSRSDFGLDTEDIQTLRRKLTKVIHCAWAVNFNLGVSSFERQHIIGVHNLISFCLSVSTPRPAEFYFCSSISVAAGTPLPASISETYIDNLRSTQNMGYARSKLVAENIVKAATEKTGIHARVLRIGQIMGDSKIGLWNSAEAIPLMIQSTTVLDVLPELDETLSWLPSDYVATAILEISNLGEFSNGTARINDPHIVYHIQNTWTFHWTKDLLPALREAGLSFHTVPQREWVRLLRSSSLDPVQNPPIKLLDFFTSKYDNDGLGRNDLVFITEKTALESKTVKQGFNVIGSGLVAKVVQRWMEEWTSA